MVSDDLLDVDAGGIVGKDKGNPIAVAGGKRRGTHGDPSYLKQMRGIKREVVEGEDELSQAEEDGGGWRWFRSLLLEEAESPKTLL
eukprot:g20220.t1